MGVSACSAAPGVVRGTLILLIVSSHPILSSLHGLDSPLEGGKCSASVSVLSEGAAAGMLLALAAPEALMSALALWHFGNDTHKPSAGLSPQAGLFCLLI